MNRTLIEWVKNPDGTQGYTWNPITGCLKGCEYCYARRLAETRLLVKYSANPNQAPDGFGNEKMGSLGPFWPRFWPERVQEPLEHKRTGNRIPRGVFACDMGELFGPWLPHEWTEHVVDVIRACGDDRFYLLTKQPQELPKWSPFPENCWVGVSATDKSSFGDAMVGLGKIRASVRYISFEPLLSRIEMWEMEAYLAEHLDWVIIGAQTKPTVMPHREWVEEIEAACDRAGIPVFEKNSMALLFPERPLRRELPE